MKGLEVFFAFSPFRWVHCSILFRSPSRFEISAKRILNTLQYRCDEWIGNEKSAGQLGAFYRDADRTPELILYLMHRKTLIQCDLLIPIHVRGAYYRDRYKNEVVPGNEKVTDASA